MSLHITVVPASSQGGKETIRNLLRHASQPRVRGVYRDIAKAPAEFTDNVNFEPVQGDVSKASPDFSGSDAVLYIPPPTFEDVDVAEFATNAAHHVKAGLERASVKRVLLFSAMGSQYDPDAIGVLKINHITDKILAASAPEVVVIKPGWFHENWAEAFATVKQEPAYFESVFTPADYEIPMVGQRKFFVSRNVVVNDAQVSIVDVGRACAQKLLETGQTLHSCPYVFELFGPRHYSTLDVRQALEKASGKSISIVPVEPEKLAEHFAKHMPTSQVQTYVNMITATLAGGVMAGDYKGDGRTERGVVELTDSLGRLFAETQ
ncbi:hypothetical protein VDGD_09582 [Verticillium dahliae]|nr:hypothetical protein VDGD_09582 [Verticillium dahliae]